MILIWTKHTFLRALAITAALVAVAGTLLGAVNAGRDSVSTSGQPGRLLPVYRVEQAAGKKQLALTFDAAWGTEQIAPILDALAQANVKCTFFLVGFWVDEYADLVRKIMAAGHEFGNHSTNHLHMAQLTREQMEADLKACSQKIFALTGQSPKLFRAPFGEYSDTLLRVASENGLAAVQWSLDARDWDGLKASEIVKRITQKAAPGDIVLMHINQPAVAEALPEVLQRLQGDGYELVPLSQLLLTGPTVVDTHGVQRPA